MRVGWTTVLAALAVVLSSCTMTVDGAGQQGAPGAIVALMDTGVYPTTAGPPMGTVGDLVDLQRLMEAERMAEFVAGPWQVDASLHSPGPWLEALATGPQIDEKYLRRDSIVPDPLPAVATAHGLVTAFSTQRFTADLSRGLRNVVFLFPDDASASAAATEMAAKNPPPETDPGQRVTLDKNLAATATTYSSAATDETHGFEAYGRYVFFAKAFVSHADTSAFTSASMVDFALTVLKQKIEGFVPTDPTKLPDLPKDVSGRLLAQTLWAPDDNRLSFIVGAYPATAWLHYEQNPVQALALFRDTGVDFVMQRLSTVYQAASAESAVQLFDALSTEVDDVDGAAATDAVPGYPSARCYERDQPEDIDEGAVTLLRVAWRFKCVGHADRYAFTTYSQHETDVMQQISAQYRILAGE